MSEQSRAPDHQGRALSHSGAGPRPGWLLVVVAFASIGLCPYAACQRRAAGTCAEDVDCAPGFDCRAGVCARRERMRFGTSAPEGVPPPTKDTAAPRVEQPSGRPLDPPAPDASSSAADGPATPPATRRPPPAAPKQPEVPAPPPLPTPPPGGREPMWKQRLRNS